MFRKAYDFSGIAFAISSDESFTAGEKLSRFECNETERGYRVYLEFADALPGPDSEAAGVYRRYSKGSEKPGVPYAYVEYRGEDIALTVIEEYRGRLSAEDVLRLIDFNHLLLENNAVVVHASYISTPAGAILFSAPCGTGKSTQAQLWKEHRSAVIVNGDRCIIRATDDGFTAGGVYYSGTSEFCENITSPLRAVVLLEQAEENSVSALNGADGFMKLLRQCAYKNDMSSDPMRAVELISRLINEAPVFRLACLPDVSAVEALEAAL